MDPYPAIDIISKPKTQLMSLMIDGCDKVLVLKEKLIIIILEETYYGKILNIYKKIKIGLIITYHQNVLKEIQMIINMLIKD